VEEIFCTSVAQLSKTVVRFFSPLTGFYSEASLLQRKIPVMKKPLQLIIPAGVLLKILEN
jgi:hypothetical protein